MTIDISNNAARVNYTVASGVTQTSFSVPFEFFNDGDLSVYVDDVLKTITTHYTVSGGDGSTGTITMSVTGAAGGSTVVISRSIAIERTSDFQTGVDINRAALNTQLDTLTAIAADNQDKASRSISAPNSEVNPVLELPDADTRKGKLIGFNETTGNIELSVTLADGNTLASISGDIATLADIEDGTDATDAIQTVAGISSNVTTVAGVSANVTTVAGNTTNINTVAGNDANITTVADNVSAISIVSDDMGNVIAVATNAANINTVAADGADIGTVATSIASVDTAATNIASINTNATNITDIQNASANAATATTQAGIATTQAGIATTKASEAATSETNAATSETNAATSETNASTSETNAATSATNAASSATNAGSSAGAALNFQTQAGIYSSNAASSASSALSSKNSASSFATNSANSATSASNSASTATTKASEAAASKTAAEAAKVAAEAALDEFTDIYLGAKASDPTTDNDGNALTAGDQYFNTTINVLKIYNGSAWQAAAIDSSGFVETTGDTMTGNLTFGDNDKAIFGAGSDLQIYHDGTRSYLDDVGAGSLWLRGGDVAVKSTANESMAEFANNGAVTLYYDNAPKLATTSTGIDVTGTANVDVLTQTNGAGTLTLKDLGGSSSEIEASGTLHIDFQGSNFEINTNDTARFNISSGGDISFYDSQGSSQSFFWDASAERLGLGATSPDNVLHADNAGSPSGKFSGNGGSGEFALEIGQLGTNGSAGLNSTSFNGTSAAMKFQVDGSEAMRIDSSGSVGIGTSSPSDVLHLGGSSNQQIRINSSKNPAYVGAFTDQLNLAINRRTSDGAIQNTDRSAAYISLNGPTGGSTISFSTAAAINTQPSERMRIDSSGNVGIGTSSPDQTLHVEKSVAGGGVELLVGNSGANQSGTYSQIGLGTGGDSTGTAYFRLYRDGSGISELAGYTTQTFLTDSTERMRIGSSGVLSVANTTTAYGLRVTSSLTGMSYTPTDYLTVAADNGPCFYGNRTGSNGDIMVFNKDGSTVGSIGSRAGVVASLVLDPRGSGAGLTADTRKILPSTETGATNDGLVDLGRSSGRFKDLYLSGDVFVNKTTKTAAGSGIVLDGDGFAYFVRDGAVQILLGNDDTGGTSQEAIRFVRASSDVGSIDTTSTSTAYNTSSDYRLKTDAQPMTGASARVQALNPVNFEWIANGTRVDGFLAHEAQEVVPEAVTGTKDAMRDEEYEVTPAVLDDDGNEVTPAVMGTRSVPDYQGIDQSKLVPLLTAALQEALTKIDALETRITTLEG